MINLKSVCICWVVSLLTIAKNSHVSASPTRSGVENNDTKRLKQGPVALLQYKHAQTKHGIIKWSQTDKNSYVHGGMDFSEDKYIVLPSSGYYDVQTRIQMDTYTVDMPVSKEVLIRLAINVMDPNGNVRTLMEEKFILGYKQMFGKQLGPSMFFLSKGSVVYVVMNNHTYINPSKHNTFGIRKWSD